MVEVGCCGKKRLSSPGAVPGSALPWRVAAQPRIPISIQPELLVSRVQAKLGCLGWGQSLP